MNWSSEMVHRAHQRLDKVVVGVQPDLDFAGVVVAGLDAERRYWVLEDASVGGTPEHRYSQVCRAAFRWNAAAVVYDDAYGADTGVAAIRGQWKALQATGEFDRACPPVTAARITSDRAGRAGPVVALYEQQAATGRPRIRHAPPTATNGLAKLENEMLTWEPARRTRIDALVVAVRYLMRQWRQP